MYLDKYQVLDDNLEQFNKLLSHLTGTTINLMSVDTPTIKHDILVITRVQNSIKKTDVSAIAEIFARGKMVEISKFIFFTKAPSDFYHIIMSHYKAEFIWCCNDSSLASDFDEIQPLDRAPISGEELPIPLPRQFVYKLKPAQPDNKYYKPYKHIKLANVDLLILSSLDDGSCFFHSILYAITPNYNRLSPSKQQASVRKFRTSLAQNITPEIFKTLGNGHTASLLMSIQKANNNTLPDDQLLEQIRQNYVATLSDPRQYAGEEYIDLIYRFLNVGILLLTPNTDGDPTIYRWGEPDNYYKKCKKFVLMWYERNHYDVIVSPTQTSFEQGHPVVELFKRKN